MPGRRGGRGRGRGRGREREDTGAGVGGGGGVTIEEIGEEEAESLNVPRRSGRVRGHTVPPLEEVVQIGRGRRGRGRGLGRGTRAPGTPEREVLAQAQEPESASEPEPMQEPASASAPESGPAPAPAPAPAAGPTAGDMYAQAKTWAQRNYRMATEGAASAASGLAGHTLSAVTSMYTMGSAYSRIAGQRVASGAARTYAAAVGVAGQAASATVSVLESGVRALTSTAKAQNPTIPFDCPLVYHIDRTRRLAEKKTPYVRPRLVRATVALSEFDKATHDSRGITLGPVGGVLTARNVWRGTSTIALPYVASNMVINMNWGDARFRTAKPVPVVRTTMFTMRHLFAPVMRRLVRPEQHGPYFRAVYDMLLVIAPNFGWATPQLVARTLANQPFKEFLDAAASTPYLKEFLEAAAGALPSKEGLDAAASKLPTVVAQNTFFTSLVATVLLYLRHAYSIYHQDDAWVRKVHALTVLALTVGLACVQPWVAIPVAASTASAESMEEGIRYGRLLAQGLLSTAEATDHLARADYNARIKEHVDRDKYTARFKAQTEHAFWKDAETVTFLNLTRQARRVKDEASMWSVLNEIISGVTHLSSRTAGVFSGLLWQTICQILPMNRVYFPTVYENHMLMTALKACAGSVLALEEAVHNVATATVDMWGFLDAEERLWKQDISNPYTRHYPFFKIGNNDTRRTLSTKLDALVELMSATNEKDVVDRVLRCAIARLWTIDHAKSPTSTPDSNINLVCASVMTAHHEVLSTVLDPLLVLFACLGEIVGYFCKFEYNLTPGEDNVNYKEADEDVAGDADLVRAHDETQYRMVSAMHKLSHKAIVAFVRMHKLIAHIVSSANGSSIKDEQDVMHPYLTWSYILALPEKPPTSLVKYKALFNVPGVLDHISYLNSNVAGAAALAFEWASKESVGVKDPRDHPKAEAIKKEDAYALSFASALLMYRAAWDDALLNVAAKACKHLVALEAYRWKRAQANEGLALTVNEKFVEERVRVISRIFVGEALKYVLNDADMRTVLDDALDDIGRLYEGYPTPKRVTDALIAYVDDNDKRRSAALMSCIPRNLRAYTATVGEELAVYYNTGPDQTMAYLCTSKNRNDLEYMVDAVNDVLFPVNVPVDMLPSIARNASSLLPPGTVAEYELYRTPALLELDRTALQLAMLPDPTVTGAQIFSPSYSDEQKIGFTNFVFHQLQNRIDNL